MTGKELLYVEDALGHEQYMGAQCCNTAQQLQDSELKDLAENLGNEHNAIFKSFYNLI